jgi:hypothetical protein
LVARRYFDMWILMGTMSGLADNILTTQSEKLGSL